jgi:hypothetical protein
MVVHGGIGDAYLSLLLMSCEHSLIMESWLTAELLVECPSSEQSLLCSTTGFCCQARAADQITQQDQVQPCVYLLPADARL